MIKQIYDVIIVGGGPAGMAAALGAAQITNGDEENGGNKRTGVRGQGSGDEGSLRKNQREAQRSGFALERTNNVTERTPEPARVQRNEVCEDEGIPHSPRVVIIERADRLGGILNQCTHTGFGITYFGEELTGQEYARRFAGRVESSEIDVLTGTMVLNIGADRVVTISGANTGFRQIEAKTVILATGCRERPAGALPIVGARPAGVFTAGSAQKMLNLGGYDIGNRFVILGSGDVGMIVARELAMRGKDVIAVIEKEDRCGGLARNRINCLERYGIPLITRATVSEIHGMLRICGVTMTELYGGSERYIECDTLITSVGLIPERDLLDALIACLNSEFCIQNSPPFTAGRIPDWLYLCGNAAFVHDVVDGVTIGSEQIGRSAAIAALQS